MCPPSPWKEFLLELDSKLTECCHLSIMGGYAVTQVMESVGQLQILMFWTLLLLV